MIGSALSSSSRGSFLVELLVDREVPRHFAAVQKKGRASDRIRELRDLEVNLWKAPDQLRANGVTRGASHPGERASGGDNATTWRLDSLAWQRPTRALGTKGDLRERSLVGLRIRCPLVGRGGSNPSPGTEIRR